MSWPVQETLVNNEDNDESISDTELVISHIWKNILKIETVEMDDNFFELGGHSLLAVELFSKIQMELGLKLPISTLFTHSTIRLLSNKIISDKPEGKENSNGANSPWYMFWRR